MSKIAALIIFYSGTACISPAVQGDGFTELKKVPCFEVMWVPSANPFKVTQEANVISLTTIPKVTVKRKTGACGAKRQVWYVKAGKKRYRCR